MSFSGTKSLESMLFGQVRIGTVTSVDAENFRCEIDYPDSLGGAKNVAINPSPMIGFMPTVGTVCAIYDKPGWDKRMLMPLQENVSQEIWPESKQLEEGTDLPGLVDKTMQPGDVYVGRGARVRLKAAGDMLCTTAAGRATFELVDGIAKARMTAHNFDIKSFGNTIRVFTKASVPASFGDEFLIEKNVTTAGLPDTAPEAIPTNITRMKIDTLGGFCLDVSAFKSKLEMTALGDITLGNLTAGLAIDIDQDIRLLNLLGGLNIEKDGNIQLASASGGLVNSGLELRPTGYTLLYNSSSSLNLDEAGGIELGNLGGDFIMQASGASSISSVTAGAYMGFDAAGLVDLIGNKVDITAGVEVLLKSALISLGQIPAGQVAIATPISAVITAMLAFLTISKTHTHEIKGTATVSTGPTAGTPIIGATGPSLEMGAAPLPTSEQASIAVLGSKTVSVQA